MAQSVLTLEQIIGKLQTRWLTKIDGADVLNVHTRTWEGAEVRYSIPATSPVGSQGEGGPNFTPSTAHQADFARQAFELWDDLVAIDLIETTSASEQITFAYSTATQDDGTYTSPTLVPLPGGGSQFERTIQSERIWFSQSPNWSENQDANIAYGNRGLENYIHEIGHALGLSHPGAYNAGTSPNYTDNAEYTQDTRQWTVMSYFDAGDDGTTVDRDGTDRDGVSGDDEAFAASPLLHDVMTIQRKYGADLTTRTGDDTYGFNYRTSGPDRGSFDFTRNVDPVICIWDANGTDTLDVSGYAENQVINLEAGVFSDVGRLTKNVVIAYGATIEHAIGGSGNDSINGNVVANRLQGMSGDDYLTGFGGGDVLVGDGTSMTGNDTLDGSDGADTLLGGRGNDVYVVDSTGDVVSEQYRPRVGLRLLDAGGNDTVMTYLASFDLNTPSFNVENLESLGETATFRGVGNGLSNRINGSDASTDTLVGGAGNDTLWGGALDDRLSGGVGSDSLLGGDGNDYLTGEAESSKGNDTLDGGAGNDTMRGGNGNDVYVVDSSGDAVLDTVLVGLRWVQGSGFDTIRTTLGFYQLSNSTISMIEGLAYIGNSDFQGFGNMLANRITGGDFDDTLVGGNGNDTLDGGEGADALYGENDDDILYGGAGNDFVDGEAGRDYVSGGEGDDTVVGGGGNDTLDGGTGVDELDGATGNDTYIIGELGDLIVESAGEGIDTARVLGVSGYVLDAFVENMRVGGFSGFIVATGNDLANNISVGRLAPGATAAFMLVGADGNDTITGGRTGLGDLLDGGAGNDNLSGAAGTDVLRGGEGADTLDGGTGRDTADYSLAAATIIVNMSLTVEGRGGEARGDDFVSIENVIGSGFGDTITGNSEANALVGRDGSDNLAGGDGRDTLDGGAGNDTLNGGAGNDSLDGGADSDILFGGAGVDTLRGGEGDDFLTVDNFAIDIIDGGAGYDRVEASAGTVAAGFKFALTAAMNVEAVAGNGGNDVLDASLMTTAVYVVGWGGNDLITGGSAGDYLTGDAYSFSPAGRDTMHGGGGSDLMYGYSGDDLMYGDGGFEGGIGDRLWGGTGNDTIYGGGSSGYLLGEEGNDILFAGDNDWALGGDGNDVITGSGAAEQLEGGAGNDTMTGGAGADLFELRFDAGGADTITDFELGLDKIRFHNISSFDSRDDLVITDVAGGALVVFSGPINGSITVLGAGVSAATLDADQFAFLVL